MSESPRGSGRRPPDGTAPIWRDRRERFLAAVGDGVAVLPAALPQVRSRDSEYRYRPDSDLYYLTGFREPDAVAVLSPFDDSHCFTLFVRPRDPDAEAWSGARAGAEGAREGFGADAAYPIEELAERLPELLWPAERIIYRLGTHAELDTMVVDCLERFRTKRPRSGEGPLAVADPALWLHPMRRIKDDVELDHLRSACGLTAEAHRAAMAAVAPDRGEWEIEAVLEHRFRSGGGAGAAFASIVAGGDRATVLHYVDNERRLREGELVLIDAGAELGMYCGDVTRTVPVSGRFSAIQRAAYEVVRSALDAAIEAVRPGASASAPHDAAVRVLCEGMVDLGLLAGPAAERIEDESYKRFFMHRTSHWLGLDVHDVGEYVEDGAPVPLEAGMVLTVEPGLYVPLDGVDLPTELRGMGIRLEDDVVVRPDGPEVLTRAAPIEPDEVEALAGSMLDGVESGRR